MDHETPEGTAEEEPDGDERSLGAEVQQEVRTQGAVRIGTHRTGAGDARGDDAGIPGLAGPDRIVEAGELAAVAPAQQADAPVHHGRDEGKQPVEHLAGHGNHRIRLQEAPSAAETTADDVPFPVLHGAHQEGPVTQEGGIVQQAVDGTVHRRHEPMDPDVEVLLARFAPGGVQVRVHENLERELVLGNRADLPPALGDDGLGGLGIDEQGDGFHQSSFNTAMNALWGTWTVPIWRIRFLPSFCFSRSLRLRVTSPP